MTTLIKLQKELKPYKDTLVIGDLDNVVRLADVIDGDDDYYWVYDTMRGITHASCVGGWIPLKGFIPSKDYDRLVVIWNYNNTEKAI
ncbi:MAG: hypothetical protein IID16_00840 [Candidatus Marinimicrobia bacterium]|nr:hypothetical protein [Candidatus Neomarinimicrobiota bacterium]